MGVLLPHSLSLSLFLAVASTVRSLHSAHSEYTQAVFSAHRGDEQGEGEREWPFIFDD
jgi:hypothetical protein